MTALTPFAVLLVLLLFLLAVSKAAEDSCWCRLPPYSTSATTDNPCPQIVIYIKCVFDSKNCTSVERSENLEDGKNLFNKAKCYKRRVFELKRETAVTPDSSFKDNKDSSNGANTFYVASVKLVAELLGIVVMAETLRLCYFHVL
ncbi:hypothetical protein DdX_14063 [Ditylenchus destructor]|uniref:Uncharacterized protein n=1 Tax=Ditylenchus destructor TaxID=166010 RepID=A0AAD4MVA3_9BILA|nr:hypothetical protein DdX_14063 [Ditylenchus destructor]